jgi:hypothetical protein
MEEASLQKTHGSNEHDHCVEGAKEETPKRPPAGGKRGGQKGVGWTVWLLIVLIGFLVLSSLANLVVSHQAYESSRKQVAAIEHLTQSLRDIQGSIVNLSRMLEQGSSEEEEPEEDKGGSVGDGSI